MDSNDMKLSVRLALGITVLVEKTAAAASSLKNLAAEQVAAVAVFKLPGGHRF